MHTLPLSSRHGPLLPGDDAVGDDVWSDAPIANAVAPAAEQLEPIFERSNWDHDGKTIL